MNEEQINELIEYNLEYFNEALTDEQIANSMLDKVELEAKLQEKDKEIERLTAESTEWESKCYKYQDIINELKKDLEEKIDEDRLNLLSNCHWTYVLDKLKELKEGK